MIGYGESADCRDDVWPDPDRGAFEEGARILDELHAAFIRYVVLPSSATYDAVTLWAAATHALPAFQHAARLAITSPEKRCGKSRLLDVIEATCHDPLITVNASVSAVFRSIGKDHPPTLLVDEADSIFGRRTADQHEELRALLNAGHQRNRPALRCVGPQQTPTAFPTFSMAALAGIGELPDTIADRAVNIRMHRRQGATEPVAQFRSRVDAPKLHEIRERLAAWSKTQMDRLKAARPEMPVEDRAADTWEPLVAVADVAGGDWPKRARAACLVLVAEADEADAEGSIGNRLLSDLRDLFDDFAVSFVSTQEVVLRLRAIEDAPWRDEDLTAHKLADRLRLYRIKPRRNTAGTTRGYRREDLLDAWRRFLPTPRQEPSERQIRRSEPSASDVSDTSKCQSVRTDGPATSTSDALTLSDGGSGQSAGYGPCLHPGCGRATLRYGPGGSPSCDAHGVGS